MIYNMLNGTLSLYTTTTTTTAQILDWCSSHQRCCQLTLKLPFC